MRMEFVRRTQYRQGRRVRKDDLGRRFVCRSESCFGRIEQLRQLFVQSPDFIGQSVVFYIVDGHGFDEREFVLPHRLHEFEESRGTTLESLGK